MKNVRLFFQAYTLACSLQIKLTFIRILFYLTREGYTVKSFFQGISWNTVSGWFHDTWNNFMKYFYFRTQDSLRTLEPNINSINCIHFINKKLCLQERYRVKFNSLKKYLLLIKQKQKFQKYHIVSEWKHVQKAGATEVYVRTYF